MDRFKLMTAVTLVFAQNVSSMDRCEDRGQSVGLNVGGVPSHGYQFATNVFNQFTRLATRWGGPQSICRAGNFVYKAGTTAWECTPSADMCLGGISAAMYLFPKLRERYWYLPLVFYFGMRYSDRCQMNNINTNVLRNRVEIVAARDDISGLDRRMNQGFEGVKTEMGLLRDGIDTGFSGVRCQFNGIGNMIADGAVAAQDGFDGVKHNFEQMAKVTEVQHQKVLEMLKAAQRQGGDADEQIKEIAKTCGVTQENVKLIKESTQSTAETLQRGERQISTRLDQLSADVARQSRLVSLLMFSNLFAQRRVPSLCSPMQAPKLQPDIPGWMQAICGKFQAASDVEQVK